MLLITSCNNMFPTFFYKKIKSKYLSQNKYSFFHKFDSTKKPHQPHTHKTTNSNTKQSQTHILLDLKLE